MGLSPECASLHIRKVQGNYSAHPNGPRPSQGSWQRSNDISTQRISMTRAEQYAFIDEYGVPSLETHHEGVSQYFIVAAVLVSEEDLAAARQGAERIRAKFFQTGEIKSSRVGQKHNRRQRVLTAIAELPIRLLAVAVNKEDISTNGGLIYKKPFFKFISGQLYRWLYGAIPSLAVTADKYGTSEYMASFSRYVEVRHMPNLFSDGSVRHELSKKEPLIQIADFIAGTIARAFDRKKFTERSSDFLKTLRPLTIEIMEWPLSFGAQSSDLPRSESDDDVGKIAMASAERFLSANLERTDHKLVAQCCALTYLIYFMRSVDSEGYVTTKQLIEILESETGLTFNERKVQSSVIAPLRDEGVLIGSRRNRGYKFPTSLDDVLCFVDFASEIALPLLQRVRVARRCIRLASSGKIDILEQDNYEELRRLLERTT